MSRPRIVMSGPEAIDADAYIAEIQARKRFHHPWIVAPTDREAWGELVARHATPEVEVLFAVRREDGAVTGTFVLSQIFYGPFRNTYLGYWATQAHAGAGYMTEGMAGVLRHAFRSLRLHRVEANVQPGNTASVGLLERSGSVARGSRRGS